MWKSCRKFKIWMLYKLFVPKAQVFSPHFWNGIQFHHSPLTLSFSQYNNQYHITSWATSLSFPINRKNQLNWLKKLRYWHWPTKLELGIELLAINPLLEHNKKKSAQTDEKWLRYGPTKQNIKAPSWYSNFLVDWHCYYSMRWGSLKKFHLHGA